MFFNNWLKIKSSKKSTMPVKKVASLNHFKPLLESLDDRLAPHASPFWSNFAPFGSDLGILSSSLGSNNSTAVATQFAVYTAPQTYAGEQTKVTVVALDATNRPVPNYTGTVALTSSDSAATLPANYTFTADDHGRHTFVVTLPTVDTGTPTTITATDTTTATITGQTTVNVNAAPVATSLFVQIQRNVYTGVATSVLVAALDSSNHVVPTYTGTVALSSTDASTTLPASYTFTAADRGVKIFSITPGATGSETITATDATNSLSGKVTATVNAAPVVAKLAVRALPFAQSGAATQFLVVALDANNQVVPNYTGTVHITSSDSTATLPADYTFTAADKGVKLLSVTFGSTATGKQSVTATDTVTSSLTASVNINVGTGGFGFGGFGGGFGGHGFGGERFGWRG